MMSRSMEEGLAWFAGGVMGVSDRRFAKCVRACRAAQYAAHADPSGSTTNGQIAKGHAPGRGVQESRAPWRVQGRALALSPHQAHTPDHIPGGSRMTTELHPLGDTLGTEAIGLDLSRPLDEAQSTWVKQAF